MLELLVYIYALVTVFMVVFVCCYTELQTLEMLKHSSYWQLLTFTEKEVCNV